MLVHLDFTMVLAISGKTHTIVERIFFITVLIQIAIKSRRIKTTLIYNCGIYIIKTAFDNNILRFGQLLTIL